MSEDATKITAAHLQYIRALTEPEGPFLEALRTAARDAGIPTIAICPEQGSFLRTLVRLSRAKLVVEVGTLAGYSAIWLAGGLPPDGRLITIEKHPAHAAFAREWIGRSPYAGRVEVIEGSGSEALARLRSGTVDGMFLDADKGGYLGYVEEAARLLVPHGWIAVDNAFAFGELFSSAPRDRETPAVKAFNAAFAKDARFQGVIVPMGDGFWLASKRAP